jgi:hypothetical protein
MSKLIVQSTPDGLSVPAETLERAGVEPGRFVELVPLPGAQEIVYRALGECVRKLGDALGVGDPRWNAMTSEWEVDVYAPGERTALGRLIFNVRGELEADRSSTREELLAAHHAARAQDTAA